MAGAADVAEDSGVSIALTPVQLYAVLNGKDISQGELASNTWHEMPLPPDYAAQRFIEALRVPVTRPDPRQDAWSRQTHYSQPHPPDCWVPPPVLRADPESQNRGMAVLQIIGGGLEMAGGALLLLAPEPTMLTKVGGSVLTVHGLDVAQAAIRQLFSGKAVEDYTQMGASWAVRQMGASDDTAQRVGVILDVAVPFVVSAGLVAERVLAIRAGRIILPEEAAAGKAGRVALQDEEAAGGHTIQKHVNRTDQQLADRLISEPYIPASSCWTSVRVAEDVVTDTIRSNKAAIEAWAKSAQIRLELKYLGSSPIGRGIVRATGKMQPMTNAIVRLRKVQMAGRAYFIVTSYPAP